MVNNFALQNNAHGNRLCWCIITVAMIKIIFLFASLSLVTSAQADLLDTQRQFYLQARAALGNNDVVVFNTLRSRLTSYPLYPYLVYDELLSRLDTASDDEIQAFLESYADTPLKSRLHNAWLHKLMERGRWQAFLKTYKSGGDAELRCYYLRSRVRAGDLDGIDEPIERLWLVGKSQHGACDRVFDWYERQGKLNSELVWQRVYLAMKNNNTSLARYLSQALDESAQNWINFWISVHNNPASGLRHEALRPDSELTRRIIAHGIKRYSRVDLEKAKLEWDTLKLRYAFNPKQSAGIDEKFGLRAAYSHHPSALSWLDAVPDQYISDHARVWRARTALRSGNWQALVERIDALAVAERQRDKWQYWKARAMAATDRDSDARLIYSRLAEERDYYGFLAADLLSTEYQIVNDPLPRYSPVMDRLLKLPGITRARELYHVGQVLEARREWNRVIADLDEAGLKMAAVLADNWNWHDYAIRTVAKGRHFDDLYLRFPTPYRSNILNAARQQNLEPAWIYGIIRRESAFNHDARSPVGATGLMQLMPKTARQVAKSLKLSRPGYSALVDPEQNIRLGSAYMRQLLDRYANHQVLATAAYNAGPSRVTRWSPENNVLPADLWVDTIPFTETRRYVRAVMAYTTIFEWKLYDKTSRLSKRMQPVPRKTGS